MLGKMTIIPPDGEISVIEYRTSIPLEHLQRAVDGYIEVVPFFHSVLLNASRWDCRVFCNEDGKRLLLPPNRRAQALWQDCVDTTFAAHSGFDVVAINDYLCGPVAIVTGDAEFMEDL